MCKSHNFLMISNCDFLSSDIVISKSASSVRGLSVDSVDSVRVRLQMSSISSLSRLCLAPPGSLAPLSLLSTLYIRLEMEMSRDPSHWPPHKPEKARAERSRAIS